MKSTRNTQQKRIILNALMCAEHPTASELHEIISKEYPTISRATVFRVLSQFADRGVVNRVCLDESSSRFDACTKPHAHFHCLKCGRIFDVYDKETEEFFGKKQVGGFEVCSVGVEFSGVCNDCKDKIN